MKKKTIRLKRKQLHTPYSWEELYELFNERKLYSSNIQKNRKKYYRTAKHHKEDLE